MKFFCTLFACLIAGLIPLNQLLAQKISSPEKETKKRDKQIFSLMRSIEEKKQLNKNQANLPTKDEKFKTIADSIEYNKNWFKQKEYQIKQLRALNVSLEKKIVLLQNSRSNFIYDNKALQAKIYQLDQKLRNSSAELETKIKLAKKPLEKDIARLNQENSRLSKELKSLNSQMAKLNKKQAKNKKAILDAKHKRKESETLVKIAVQEKKGIGKKLKQTEKENLALNERISSLQDELTESRIFISKNKNNIKKINAAVIKVKENIYQLLEKNDDLKNRLNQTNASLNASRSLTPSKQ